MRYGDFTMITADAVYSSGVAELTFEPRVDSRYLIFELHSVGVSADAGDQNIVTSMLDVRRSTDYIVGGNSPGSREDNNRGVALADLASVNGGDSPIWHGSFDQLKRTVSHYAPSEEASMHAIEKIQELYGELTPDVCAIPLDGDFVIRLKDMAAGDTPSSMSLLVMYLGESANGFDGDLPILNRPIWHTFPRVALGTTAVIGQVLKERLQIADERYGAGGYLKHRAILGSLFAQSNYAIETDSRALVRLSTSIGSCRSIFEPEFAPLLLIAKAHGQLPLTFAEVRDNEEIGYEYETDTLSAALYLHLSNQYSTER